MYINSFYFWMKVESLAKKCFFLGIVVTGTQNRRKYQSGTLNGASL